MQPPNAQPSDLGAQPSQGLTAQNPQQPQVQAIPSAEDLTDIRQKLAALDTMMQGNPAYVEARRRGDWQTAAREAEKAGHHDLARVYQMLHEKMTGAPLNVTPYQNPAAKAGDEQGAARPTPAPVPVHPVDSLLPVDIPKSVGARRDFGRGIIKAMRMRNIPVVDTLKEGLRDGKKDALKHALKRIAQADEEDAILRGETAAQRANDGDEAQAEPREKQGDEVQAKSAQNTEGNADDHMEWIAAHPFRYDDAKSMEENIRDAEALAQEYLDAFGTTDQINTPERQELRRKIADKLYGEGAAKKEGKVWLVLGVPASGKSTFSDPLVEKEGALLIDSDEGKKLLPEFSNGLLAGAVHEESAAIANAIVKRAVRNRDNLILPLVGKTFSSLQERVNVLKEAGYEVNLIYVDLPIEKAIERTKARFRETGRLVSPNYLHNVGLKPKQNYDKIKTKREVDSYEAWSNDVHYGDNPIPLENSTEGMLETKSRMGGRRQLDSDVRSGSETSDKGTQHRGTPINTANRSDNQGGFSTPKKSVQVESAPLTKQEQEALTGTSEEAKEAYRVVRDKLAKSKNKAVARAAKVGATLFARHADIYAKAYSKATGKPYTALDYLHDKFGLDADGKEADGRANGLGQRTSADVPASQKEAVRKQYAGTALWMKAPNGKATNLTEDQWLTVRTPAFKAWFGDWEHDPANASKVVDENGEPLVVYHATLSDFTKFRPSESGLYGRGIYLTANKEDTSYTLKGEDW
ncbi:zeta toxin family protein, partial [uncultured Selenomonas sp.]|uniref:zeta toxin family protein n=1 Tax=uncultured Selenomonas sp. TaxID=159275 RepID=UPI0028DC0CC7